MVRLVRRAYAHFKRLSSVIQSIDTIQFNLLMCSGREIIAVNQDKLGKQGKRVAKVLQNPANKIMLANVQTTPGKAGEI